MRLQYFLLPAFAALIFACGGKAKEVTSEVSQAADTATNADEWEVLFDGKNLDAWHKYGGDDVGEAWTIEDGMLHLDASNKDENGAIIGGGDIVTDEVYNDYELQLEWKIGPCGNSGIIYNIVETADNDFMWLTGPEMQVLDNSCHPDAKIYKHRAGDLYDMIAADSLAVKPAGEWNAIRLIVTDEKVEHWMNGQKVVEYVPSGDTWTAMVAGSKFKDFKDFGKSTSGKIGLQDHSDPVWYRNIRIREL